MFLRIPIHSWNSWSCSLIWYNSTLIKSLEFDSIKLITDCSFKDYTLSTLTMPVSIEMMKSLFTSLLL